jgi:hypothetical protein
MTLISGGIAIYNILKDDTAVAAIVSDRIYPLVDNQSYVIPYITYQQIYTLPHATKSGPSTQDDKVYQLNIVSNTPIACRTLSEAVRDALEYATYTDVQKIFFEDERDDWNEEITNDGACMIQQDYRLIINR